MFGEVSRPSRMGLRSETLPIKEGLGIRDRYRGYTMKKLLHIALNELLLLLKDKMAVVWMVVLPLGMTAIMGLVFGGFGGGSEAVVIDLPVSIRTNFSSTAITSLLDW